MRNYNFVQPYLWSEIQHYFLKFMIIFSEKSMLLLSVIFNFLSVQIADAIASQNLTQLYDPRITQLLGSQYDCSKQYNLRKFSLTREQKCSQVPAEKECTRRTVSVFIRAKVKRMKVFRCSVTVQENGNFCAQTAHDRYYRQNSLI